MWEVMNIIGPTPRTTPYECEETAVLPVMNIVGPAVRTTPYANEETAVLEILQKPISEVFPQRQEKPTTEIILDRPTQEQ